MKHTLALLIASTALTTAIALPALSAISAPDDTAVQSFTAVFDDTRDTMPLLFVSDDDDDEQDYRKHDSYDDDDDDDCEDDDDDHEDSYGNASNAAPAGTVAPPENGLFGNGAPPQVQVN